MAAHNPLARLAMVGVFLFVAGCGGSESSGSGEEYPIAETEAPEHQPPVTEPSGAVVTLPVLPTVYEAEPSPTCERSIALSPDGPQSIVIPPTPGLRAVAVTEHTTRLEWSFNEFSDDCRPVQLTLAVANGSSTRATPTVERVEVGGETGTAEIVYPDFLPAPNVAFAAAYSAEGYSSRTVKVLIERSADTPADPPEPTPPVTAPAGSPIACSGRTTVVQEPAGDVLTYGVGKSPRAVRKLTPALSGIDVTRAAVQIDGRTICATFTFARAPAEQDFQLTFNLHDTTTASCCASLLFRRTARRLELGNWVTHADPYRLDPVPAGGARLSGATLTISGTLPAPATWGRQARRMPAPANLAWSVTTRYYTDKYGPYFGDWLPRHEALNQPVIRHRDGTIVEPG